MHQLIAFLLCMTTCASISSALIGNVEYHLPKLNPKWIVGSETKNDNFTAIKYVPPGDIINLKEEFSVSYNMTPAATIKNSDVEQVLHNLYPDSALQVRVIDKTDQSLFCEWSVFYKNQECVHGWMRIYSSPQDTTLLIYQTTDLCNLDTIRKTWIPVLKSAKPLY